MEPYDNTERLEDLIDQIDQSNSSKKKKGIFLFFGIIAIFALTSYLSFSQEEEKPSYSDHLIIEKEETPKPQVISSSTSLGKLNTTPSEKEVDNQEIIKTGAQFLGGSEGVAQYLKENILYPDDAFDNKVEGKVLVQITIKEDGKVDNPIIIDGLGYGCDEEVIRIVSEMPNWQPAMVNQEPVKKSYILTVTFSLS